MKKQFVQSEENTSLIGHFCKQKDSQLLGSNVNTVHITNQLIYRDNLKFKKHLHQL